MTTLTKLTAAALVTGSALTFMTTAASAEIVCNAEGECWHVHHHYEYKPEFGLTVHEDNWHWGADEHYRWREHHGRGYWHNGVWIEF